MKFLEKFGIAVCFITIAFFTLTASTCNVEESSTSINSRKNENTAQKALTAVPAHIPQYFLERETVSGWFKNWDQPGKITYLYIFTQQACIGYFVCDGKPVSNQSYLTPEVEYYMNGATLPAIASDGTYGTDVNGIRFKDAKGRWYEFGGTNFSYIFSDSRIAGLPNIKLNEE
jgi:hypothetical protein